VKKSLLAAIFFSLLMCSCYPAKGQKSLDEQLHQAARDGRAEAIQPLLRAGANIESMVYDGEIQPWVTDYNKRKPLMTAAKYGKIDAVMVLLKNHANIEGADSYDNTALFWAATEGQTEIVRLLLKKGAKINAEGTEGETPLASAAEEGKTEVVQLLLEKGASIEATGSESNGTALALAAKGGNEDIVQMLLAKGAKIEAGSSSGNETPLMKAAYKGHAGVVRILLDRGANVNAKASNGTTPLMLGAASGSTDIVRMLLMKGADIHARSKEGTTPLVWAAFRHRTNVVRLLLDNGANIEEKGNDGETALSAAACYDGDSDPGGAAKPGLVKLLLEKGANFEAKAKDGQTPLTCPRRTMPPEVAALLDEAVKQRKQFDEAQSKDPSTAFAAYMSLFRQHPQDDSVREKILKIASLLPEAPTIPAEARQLFVTGTEGLKQASTPASLDLPVGLLRKAVEIAPWWGNAYYNLSRALEMQGKYDEAVQQLNYYLELKPAEADASEARAHLFVIQTEKEVATHKAQ